MSAQEVPEANVTRAGFVNKRQGRIGGKTEEEFLQGLRSSGDAKSGSAAAGADGEYLGASPLLTSTPSTISKVLINLYPYLIIWDTLLGVLTWTCDDIWPSVLIVLAYFGLVQYLDTIVRYFGHIVIVAIFIGYAKLDRYIGTVVTGKPTLENIVEIMGRISLRSDILLSPFANLNIRNVKRILLTALVLSPVHILVSWLIMPPRKLLLVGGLFVLTYHSPWSKVTRRLLWKFRVVRLAVFYTTGIDLGGINKDNKNGLLAAVQKQVNKLSSAEMVVGKNGKQDNRPIRFTYVLYENQRRWIGMGWKANMLSYERTPWTDEFLNEAPPPENFQLPSESSGMQWRWIDKTWRLDLTNDGAINLADTQSKTTAQPNPDDGYLYYDNQWKKPSMEESFSKYTRRRRWVRTAELIKVDVPQDAAPVGSDSGKDVTTTASSNDTGADARTSKDFSQNDAKDTISAATTAAVDPEPIEEKRSSKNYDKGSSSDNTVRKRMSGAATLHSDLSSSSSPRENGIRYIDE